MAQQRDAPAFQEYAASMMAQTNYRLLSLAGRGLLYSLRLECWVNGALPSDPQRLARVLGYSADEIERTLPEVSPFFAFAAGELRCPELDDYRRHLDERRQRQSAGGRAGAALTNGARTQPKPGNPAGKARGACGSLVQNSQVKNSKVQGIEGGANADPWLNDYVRESKGH